MLALKACPKCKGDMVSDRDMYGAYRQCLQCGYMMDLPMEAPARKAAARRR